jgi:hypothetical protein
MFPNDLITNPFLYTFNYGQHLDRFWTDHHTRLQLKDMIDCLKVLFPEYDDIFLFKQTSSRGHTNKQKEGLDVANTNMEWGGRVSSMHDSVRGNGDVGPHLQAHVDN